jgi:SpoVK/Ycf46/Vps4 family AAA+-type ATPase
MITNDEAEANLLITNLIKDIKVLVDRKDILISKIKSPKLLIRSLGDLKSLVEMIDIKHSIVNQIKFLIINSARTSENFIKNHNFEGHMLHSVIYGNPGTGKTTVAMILSKIWMSLGFVKKKEVSKIPNSPNMMNNSNMMNNLSLFSTIEEYRKKISELDELHRNDTRKLDKINQLLSKFHNNNCEIRRNIIKLRNKDQDDIIDDNWDELLSLTRELRFGFDEMIKEITKKNLNTPNTNSSKTNSSNSKNSKNSDETINLDPYENEDPKFIVASREDLIAEYLGQTAPKTKKVLESALGGVLFIDEAYSLCCLDNGSKDKYGEECLTTINEFMSLHSDEIIIIFAGYKDKLLNSIFKVQPGLQRRCTWFFEIQDYTVSGLVKILKLQLNKDSWILDSNIDIEKILNNNKEVVKFGGGGTEKLAFFLKLEYGNVKFQETINLNVKVEHNSIITLDMLNKAIMQIKRQLNKDDMEDVDINISMYN